MTDITEYMIGKEFFKWDVFAKEYLTNDERKMPIRYYGEYFNFFCKSADLLDDPVEITCSHPDYKFVDYTQAFMRDMMNFNFEWFSYVHKRLNGWSGIDCIKFEFDPIVKQLLNK